jgi:sugar phosphate permease
VLAASCVLTIATRNAGNPSRAQVIGLVLVATGLLALIAAFPLHSLPVLLAAALLTGAGHGTAFLGAQEEINRAAPAHQRGAVNAAFYTCVYVGVASSIISVGLLTLGLSLSTAVTAYAAFAAAAALAAAAWRQGSGSASSSPDAAAMTVRATPSQE